MILWMAQKDEKENIQEVVYALSDYYKLILNKGEDFVPLIDELRLCEKYALYSRSGSKGKSGLKSRLRRKQRHACFRKSRFSRSSRTPSFTVYWKTETEGRILIKGASAVGDCD